LLNFLEVRPNVVDEPIDIIIEHEIRLISPCPNDFAGVVLVAFGIVARLHVTAFAIVISKRTRPVHIAKVE
jgi:hypothetical protein